MYNDELDEDVGALFSSIMCRINDAREMNGMEQITILDSELHAAVRDYVTKYPEDRIVWGRY